VFAGFIYFYGSTADPCSNSMCLSKLSFKRVRKATAAFRRLGELVTPRRREELKKKFKDQGVFDFDEQTAQARPPRPVGYPPFTNPHSIGTIVREPAPFGEFTASGLYLKLHVDISGMSSCLTSVV
jgi:hypothetical protein